MALVHVDIYRIHVDAGTVCIVPHDTDACGIPPESMPPTTDGPCLRCHATEIAYFSNPLDNATAVIQPLSEVPRTEVSIAVA